jgi:hypothetical protein
MTWCTRVKIAVVAPIPRARVMMMVAANPGEERSCRKECLRSLTIYSDLLSFILKGSSVFWEPVECQDWLV